MQQSVKWLPKPENHDYQAAEDYLSLIMSPEKAAGCRQQLSAAAASRAGHVPPTTTPMFHRCRPGDPDVPWVRLT